MYLYDLLKTKYPAEIYTYDDIISENMLGIYIDADAD
jgi:hypothetical protein